LHSFTKPDDIVEPFWFKSIFNLCYLLSKSILYVPRGVLLNFIASSDTLPISSSFFLQVWGGKSIYVSSVVFIFSKVGFLVLNLSSDSLFPKQECECFYSILLHDYYVDKAIL
jgi:hypothetical protein